MKAKTPREACLDSTVYTSSFNSRMKKKIMPYGFKQTKATIAKSIFFLYLLVAYRVSVEASRLNIILYSVSKSACFNYSHPCSAYEN